MSCYFFLPVIIFLPGFFVPAIGMPAAILALAAAFYWISGNLTGGGGLRDRTEPDLVAPGLLILFAGLWALLGGAGHVFHANGTDWVPRFAVLRDLVVHDWPPRYPGDGNEELVLRAPLGYYLPTALIARGLGLPWADTILLVWTWLGVALFFVANLTGTRAQKLLGAALFMCASGLDIIGAAASTGTLPWPAQHIEWWAGNLQYSSNSTLLFWVPNHALAGWIGAAWLWRFHRNPHFLARLPILFLAVMLWSPLPAVGLLPLALVAVAMRWRECFLSRVRLLEMLKSLSLVLGPAILIAAYLLMGAAAIEHGAIDATHPRAHGETAFRIGNTLLFIGLEAGVFSLFALRREQTPLLITCIAVLALLPWFHLGPNNDLVMRGSIPALAILWFVLIAELTAEPEKQRLPRAMRTALVCLFLMGMVTPAQEVYRALNGRSWPPDLEMSAPKALGGFASHYFAPTRNSWLKPLFQN